MNQVKCPDCGEMYSEDLQSCPNCGCPNDNWKPKQETNESSSLEEDFNENGQYSPISPSSWLFTDPWPLRNYPRKAFEKAVEIYDLRIATKHDWGDKVNRAAVIQSLYGKVAFNQALDEAISHASSKQEAESIEYFRNIDCKEKQRQMFCKDRP